MKKIQRFIEWAAVHPKLSFVLALVIWFGFYYIKSCVDEKIAYQEYLDEKREKEEIERKEKEEYRKRTFYIVGRDTIAERQYVEGTMVCVYTKKVLTEKDIDKMKGFAEQFFPGDRTKMYFLFNEKKGNNEDNENYYAAYKNGEYAKAPTKEERVQKIIETLNVYTSYLKGINYSTVFLEQLNKFTEDYHKLGEDERVKRALIKFQIKHFPIARREYVKGVREKEWENDIDVKQYGSTTIEYIGHIFVANKAKQDKLNEIENELYKLRFKKAVFRWYDGSDGTSWTLSSKKDNEL